MSRRSLAMLAGAAAAAAIAGCGGASHPQTTTGADTSGQGASSTETVTAPPKPPTLLVVSSLPLTGPDAGQGRAIANGMALALHEREHASGDNLIAGFQIDYDSNNDATPTQLFSPAREANNARRAALDEHTILYVGDLASGASLVSIPILSAAGIPQIIPGSPATDLTTQLASGPAPRSEASSSFLRLVATNAYQAAAELAYLHTVSSCRLLALPHGRDDDSTDLANELRALASTVNIAVVSGGDAAVFPSESATKFSDYFQSLTRHQANCAIYAGTMAEGAVAVTEQLNRALPPGARIMGSSGVCTAAWADPAHGGAPAKLDPDLVCTAPGPSLKATTEGTAFAKDYKAAYRRAPDPMAAFGYEAMTLGIDAIANAGNEAASRSEVLQILQSNTSAAESGIPESVIGSFTVSAKGELATRTPYSVYRVAHGGLEFVTTPNAPASTTQSAVHSGHIHPPS